MMSGSGHHPELRGDELVEALEALRKIHPAGEEVQFLSYIDGALAGILLSPEPIPREEWLEHLRAGPDVRFPDPTDGERFAALLCQRQSEIAAELIEGGLTFAPLYDCDEEGNPVWQLWLAGFLSALQMRLPAWTPLFESEDEDLSAAMIGLTTLIATLPGLADQLPPGDLPDDVDELLEQAPDMLPYFVETIYRRRNGLERVIMDYDFEDGDWTFPDQPIRVAKIGRNEPCPCGSGKKYKKCCGREG